MTSNAKRRLRRRKRTSCPSLWPIGERINHDSLALRRWRRRPRGTETQCGILDIRGRRLG